MSGPAERHLLLLGAGHAQVAVLARLAQLAPSQRAGLRTTLVSPYPLLLHSAMLAGHVAGRHRLPDCTLALDGLIEASGTHFVAGRALAVDAAQRQVQVQTRGGVLALGYDLLSLNTGAGVDRQRLEQMLPGAREHALMVRPLEAFAAQWERLREHAERHPGPLVVVGGGVGGIELALALRQRLPRSPVCLVAGSAPLAADFPWTVRWRLSRALRRAQVTVVAQRCCGVARHQVMLADGSALPALATLLVTGVQAPGWLAASGLTLDGDGFVAVNPWQQSLSHPEVFAAGDVASRADGQVPRNEIHAMLAAEPLAHNLLAMATGQPLQAHEPPPQVKRFIGYGNGRALVNQGLWWAEGEWVERWKTTLAERYVARHRPARREPD